MKPKSKDEKFRASLKKAAELAKIEIPTVDWVMIFTSKEKWEKEIGTEWPGQKRNR